MTHSDEKDQRPMLCRLGMHTGPKYVTAYSQAPAALRCTRCGDLRFPPEGESCG